MALLKDVSVGERWAYRISEADRLTEVVVQGVNDSKPARVEITYAAIPESVVDSVPPSRLKVRWSERDRFLRREAQWRAISGHPNAVEHTAVDAVVDEFISPAAKIGSGKQKRGTIAIYEADLVDVFIGGGLDEVLHGAGRVNECGVKHYGWQVAVEIAKRTCRAKPERVMEFVAAEEAKEWPGVLGGGATSPKLQVMEASTRQAWDLLRDWCGRGVASPDELVRLRHEKARLQVLLDAAVALIADRVDEATARTLFSRARPDATSSDWREFLAEASRVAE